MVVRLGVIGGGNMGAALVGGLLANGWVPSDLAVVEVLEARRTELVSMFPGVTVAASVDGLQLGAALIAVKPHDVPAAVAAAVGVGADRKSTRLNSSHT